MEETGAAVEVGDDSGISRIGDIQYSKACLGICPIHCQIHVGAVDPCVVDTVLQGGGEVDDRGRGERIGEVEERDSVAAAGGSLVCNHSKRAVFTDLDVVDRSRVHHHRVDQRRCARYADIPGVQGVAFQGAGSRGALAPGAGVCRVAVHPQVGCYSVQHLTLSHDGKSSRHVARRDGDLQRIGVGFGSCDHERRPAVSHEAAFIGGEATALRLHKPDDFRVRDDRAERV